MEHFEFLVRFVDEQLWVVLLALALGVFGIALFVILHGISHPDPLSRDGSHSKPK